MTNGCERIPRKSGFCEIHYRRFLKYGNPTAGRMIKGLKGSPCSVEGCTNGIDSNMLCKAHDYRRRRYGDPLKGSPVLQVTKQDGERICQKCGNRKSLDEYPPDTNSGRGRKIVCKDCRKSRYARYYNKNRDDIALKRIRRLYGETGVEIEERRRKGAGCDVCGRHIKLAIDHDHETGAIRGLLCTPCNTALGSAEDDPMRLRDLATYLETAK